MTNTIPTNPGKALNALRRKLDHTCAACGTVFTGVISAKTCSNRCRQALKYKRTKGRTA